MSRYRIDLNVVSGGGDLFPQIFVGRVCSPTFVYIIVNTLASTIYIYIIMYACLHIGIFPSLYAVALYKSSKGFW